MAAIGILGDDAQVTASLLQRIFQEKGGMGRDSLYKITENEGHSIVSFDEKSLSVPVWILQENWEQADPAHNSADAMRDEYCCLIVNADTVRVSALRGHQGGLITYGFNPRTSVTASSVADGAVQVCIQRGFRSLSQRTFEPQEFKALCPPEADPLQVLGAVTACAVCDIPMM